MIGLSVLTSAITRAYARWRLSRWSGWLPRIDAFQGELSKLDDTSLRKHSLSMRYRARSGEPLDRLLPEAFALVRDAADRALDMRHYPVQLLGGIAMHFGSIAEMQTGEGKTLTATLPLYLASLAGKGAHLATANDYLAARDADWMRPLYSLLGVSVGVIQSQTPPSQRRQAYQCDVTYGTAKEFGFDFLRDRIGARQRQETGVDQLAAMLGQATSRDAANSDLQPALHFVLVDEADSILIDEARTPLIVSSLPGASQSVAEALYRWAAAAAPQFDETTHYDYDHESRAVTLNSSGRQLVRRLTLPGELTDVGMLDLYEHVERAIKVSRDYIRDRHYVLRDGEIVIVDEFTGRLAEGRRWRAGIHQAVEAKESTDISVETGDAARVTIQDFFLQYQRLCGMTGTASSTDHELRKIYQTGVITIPTNRPSQRRQLPDLVFGTAEAKWAAIVDEIEDVRRTRRPVLVGTRSIDKSEHLSQLLREAGIDHQVLNARQLAAEAEIVARAGQPRKVTVATNMAGRGTDVRLDDEVRQLGGLHVVCTELHESSRIDRQLIGRCGRQGDPGTFRQFMALDDDILLAGLGPRRAARLARLGGRLNGTANHLARHFRRAQANVQRQHFRQRRLLLYNEDQRRKLQLQMGQDPYLDSPE